MLILSWNCWGLGHPSAVPTLKYLVWDHKPDMIFLFETLAHANKVEELRLRLGFDCCFAVDREGRSGGVAVLWQQKSSNCTILNYSMNFINMEVVDNSKGVWRITGFYGYP